jgi:uncharacterized membrane protein
VNEISGGTLWANLHLLFWLSLVPFVTGWMGENHFETIPVAMYGLVLFMCSLSYSLLVARLVAHGTKNPALARAIGSDRKGKLSIVLYLVGVALSFVWSWLGVAVYFAMAIVWLVPDRRIEKKVTGK